MANKSKLISKIKELSITGTCSLILFTGVIYAAGKLAEPPTYCVNGNTVRIYHAPFDFPTLEVTNSNGEVQKNYDLGGFASQNITRNYPSGECKKISLSEKAME